MPVTKGDKFLIDVHAMFPDIIKIILTGHADSSAVQEAYEQANLAACFGKPWEIEDILTCLREHLSNK
ncbi:MULTISPECIES: hypothetical protein [unclassified Oleiphilus]|jgi:response regulator RpfG family c-di-GMP phosphodiesterase|uniref:hypothetical protein n=1 Tax=unclassified Oleiphilus TaxID=2631174 RepID=UPI0007C27531|nr:MULTISPECIES: hypothetical protein [unclassified Oleiphilus]KZY48865.1 hypothetical protein A3732_05585 [Oleiphilus sp. HI0050]KZY75893.1 hypothetical protein A3740_14230 [Oleiphilus sp. HI0068]KZY81774.1 hypothetical protein A3741_04230 [Oleiphilus sp. HI0069]KZY88810.1 hypothetical protein A3743_10425 [Oleiphilus sp. HI0072]KZZ11762.1 hypothetical protein A3749_00945 [Oleiphilus sp. HI0078]KZZ28806.1 hypothetical protein A3752_03555 [Oleiphilus sp. HI0081]KZZ38747.1 hypothetical protein